VGEVSIGIRAFGQLGKAIVKFMGQQELAKFLNQLLKLSERLFSGY